VFQYDSVILNIIVMTLGEIEFNDIFLENELAPFYVDVRIILLIFLFLMPIVLMNLLVSFFCFFYGKGFLAIFFQSVQYTRSLLYSTNYT